MRPRGRIGLITKDGDIIAHEIWPGNKAGRQGSTGSEIADTVTLTIDDKEIQATRGEKVLWAALDNDIYIPHLCAIREAQIPFGGCRLCFVEIEGRDCPVISCAETVREGMVVHTRTPAVMRLRRTAFELLLSNHDLDCAHCAKNRNCDLQKIAAHEGFKLKLQRFRKVPRSLPVDTSHPLFIYDPNKCVVCGKCIWACQQNGVGAIDFAHRGLEARISTFDNVPLIDSNCASCMDCVKICPVGALLVKEGVLVEQA